MRLGNRDRFFAKIVSTYLNGYTNQERGDPGGQVTVDEANTLACLLLRRQLRLRVPADVNSLIVCCADFNFFNDDNNDLNDKVGNHAPGEILGESGDFFGEFLGFAVV